MSIYPLNDPTDKKIHSLADTKEGEEKQNASDLRNRKYVSYYCRSRLEHTTEAFADLSEKRSCDVPVDSSLNISKEKSNPDFFKEKTQKPKIFESCLKFPRYHFGS